MTFLVNITASGPASRPDEHLFEAVSPHVLRQRGGRYTVVQTMRA
jgi:hypothetical protein